MRHITQMQEELVAQRLKNAGSCGVLVLCARGNDEAFRYAGELAGVLKGAGWRVGGPEPQDWTIPAGDVAVGVADYSKPGLGALALLDALNAAEISAQTDFVRAARAEPNRFCLIVGREYLGMI